MITTRHPYDLSSILRADEIQFVLTDNVKSRVEGVVNAKDQRCDVGSCHELLTLTVNTNCVSSALNIPLIC